MASYPTTVVTTGLTAFHNTNELGNSTLSAAITGVPTTFAVVNAAATTTWPTANFVVRIENELIFCTSRSGNTATIGTRGAFGTSQTDHASGTAVRVVETSAFIQAMASEIVAMEGWAGVVATMVHASVTTTPYTATSSDFLVPVNSTAAAATVNLPTAVGIKGREYVIVKTDASANTVTVDGNGTETIGGSLTVVLRRQNAIIRLMSDGANWLIVAQEMQQRVFDTVAAQGVASWVVEGPDTVSAVNAGVTSTTHGVFLRVPFSTSAVVGAIGTFGYIVEGGSAVGGVVWNNGDTLEYVVKMTLDSFTGLNADQLVGFSMSGTGYAAAAGSEFIKTGNSMRIAVGADSTGAVFLVTASGAGVTSTSTGFTAVAGTAFKVKLTFIKGTSVAVSINDGATTTNTTNLPTLVMVTNYGCGASTTTPPSPMRIFHPYYSITSTGN